MGDRTISLEEFQPRLDGAMHSALAQQVIGQGADPALVARFFATQTVNHELAAREVAALGVHVNDADVDALVAAAGGPDQVSMQLSVLGGPDDVKQAVRDYLLQAEIAKKVLPGLVVVADQIPATSRADAEKLAQSLAAGGERADQALATRGAQRAVATVGATNPDAAAQPTFGLPVGSVIAYQPSERQAGWMVARVVDRRTDAPHDNTAVQQIGLAQLAAIGHRAVQLAAVQAGGVQLNPRYGVWDEVALQAVGTPADVSGEIIAPQVNSSTAR